MEEKWTADELRVAEALFDHMALVYEFKIAWHDIGDARRTMYLQQARAAIKALRKSV